MEHEKFEYNEKLHKQLACYLPQSSCDFVLIGFLWNREPWRVHSKRREQAKTLSPIQFKHCSGGPTDPTLIQLFCTVCHH